MFEKETKDGMTLVDMPITDEVLQHGEHKGKTDSEARLADPEYAIRLRTQYGKKSLDTRRSMYVSTWKMG